MVVKHSSTVTSRLSHTSALFFPVHDSCDGHVAENAFISLLNLDILELFLDMKPFYRRQGTS